MIETAEKRTELILNKTKELHLNYVKLPSLWLNCFPQTIEAANKIYEEEQ